MDAMQAAAIERVQRMKDRRTMAEAISFLLTQVDTRGWAEHEESELTKRLEAMAAVVERN